MEPGVGSGPSCPLVAGSCSSLSFGREVIRSVPLLELRAHFVGQEGGVKADTPVEVTSPLSQIPICKMGRS